MKINLKDWQKQSADDKCTTFINKHGHELRVAHNALSKKMQAALSKLPKYAEGGVVKGEEDEEKKKAKKEEPGMLESAANVISAPIEQLGDWFAANKAENDLRNPTGLPEGSGMLAAQGTMGALPEQPAPQSMLAAEEQGRAPMAGGMAQAAPVPMGPEAPPVAGQMPPQGGPAAVGPVPAPPSQANVSAAIPVQAGALDTQIAGQRAEAKALGALGKQEAAVLEKQAQDIQALQQNYEEQRKAVSQEIDAVVADYRNGEIDPNRVWGNKNTGQRIGTAIGLLLGGLGAGLAGGENQALAMLNKEIDRDIDAQKANMDKNKGLISILNQKLGNVDAATNMARAIALEGAASQLKMAEARAKDPIAKARAQQAIGALMAEKEKAMKPVIVASQIQQLKQAARANPAQAEAALNAMEMVDPKAAESMRQLHVPGMGFANSNEGAKTVREMQGMVNSAKGGIQELLNMTDKPGKSLSLQQRAKAETISQALVGALRLPITGPGAMSDQERAMLERLVANPTAIFSLDSNNRTRLKELQRHLDRGLVNAAKSNGLQINPAASLPPDQQKFYEWAKKNPNDPKAKLILQKLNVVE